MRKKNEHFTEEASGADNAAETMPPSEAAEPTASTEQETVNSQGADTGARDYITALQAEIEELRTRAEDAEKKFVYLQAEFQTYRRRRDEEMIGLQKYANGEFIKSLLPVLDNFERALKAAEQSQNFDALIGGVSGTLKQMRAALQKAGVTPIEALGKEFDPNFHEAIGHTETDDYPPNIVAEEVQRGYMMQDRVLRPSLVKVAQG